jgi:hypothetical protein
MFSLLCRTTTGKEEFAVFVLAMAASGDLRILQWLHSKFEPLSLWNYKSEFLLAAAIRPINTANLAFFEWLYQVEPAYFAKYGIRNRLARMAACCGSLPVLKWMKHKQIAFTIPYNLVGSGGKLMIIHRMFHGIDMQVDHLPRAVPYGSKEPVLDWLIDEGGLLSF